MFGHGSHSLALLVPIPACAGMTILNAPVAHFLSTWILGTPPTKSNDFAGPGQAPE